MPQIGPLEILVVFVVALLVFGPKEIPRVARELAKGWREVQRFQASIRRELDEVLREAEEDDEDEGVTPAPVLPPKPVEAQPVESKPTEAKPEAVKPVEPDTPPDAS